MNFQRVRHLLKTLAVAASCAIVAACSGSTNNPTATPFVNPGTPVAPASLPPIKHVWVIILENQTYSATFGTQMPVPYLAQTVAAQGELLQNYYGTSHFSLGNYISLLSGQAVTLANQDDCAASTFPTLDSKYADIKVTGVAQYGQVTGNGCVYPQTALTLADQMNAAGLTWKGYMEDMGNDPTREPATCGQPIGGIGTYDNTQSAQVPPKYNAGGKTPVTDQYAARHNPFVYFESVLQSGKCQTNVVPLTALTADLASVATTPNFSFITPNLCNDGHDVPCKSPGSPTGANVYGPENQFLQTYVHAIVNSPAFKQDGLLIVTFDETSLSGTLPTTNTYVGYDGSGCCNEPTGPNTTTPGIPPLAAPSAFNIPITTGPNGISGGGQIGTMLVSPFIKPGSVSTVGYNHYYTLHTLEDIFGVGASQGYLGYAGFPGTTDFGTEVFASSTPQYAINL